MVGNPYLGLLQVCPSADKNPDFGCERYRLITSVVTNRPDRRVLLWQENLTLNPSAGQRENPAVLSRHRNRTHKPWGFPQRNLVGSENGFAEIVL